MREIIFRGKHIDGYGWETGDLIHNGDDRFTMTFSGGIAVSHDTHTDEISFDGHWLAEVDPATVGQYTGMKDRNGVRIFEGDVVAFDGGRFVVEYFESRMGFGFSGLKGRGVVSGFTMMDFEHLEVIGNVHDNPELLEV